ncbi:MAG: carboxypeptidase-like regulatory domain-containing protein [Dysgonomonas sp.]
MKNYCSTVLILFLLFSISITALSQNSNSVTITGTVTDVSTEQPIGEAGIRILNAKDSTYVNGTATNDLGIFSVNVKSGQYLVQTSFMGYTDVYTKVNATKKKEIRSE